MSEWRSCCHLHALWREQFILCTGFRRYCYWWISFPSQYNFQNHFYLILKESSNVELFLLCQVRGPSPTDPNIIMDDLLTPCSPGMRRASCLTRATCSKVNLLNGPSYHSDVFSRGMFESSMEVKSVGIFPVILLKLATPPLPPQTKLNLDQNGWKWVLFLATTLLGEVGGRRDEPKAEQKIVLRDRFLRNNCLEGLFHTVPSYFVLHCSNGVNAAVRRRSIEEDSLAFHRLTIFSSKSV